MNRKLATDLLRGIARSELLPHRFRPMILRRAGLSLGSRTLVMGGTRFARYAPIVLADGVFINYDCYLDAQAPISVGVHTSIGDHVRLLTSTHVVGTSEKRAGRIAGKPVTIGSGVWIGSGSTVLPGVTVGDGCLIAAGSVVVRDCASNCLYAGNPAELKKTLEV